MLEEIARAGFSLDLDNFVDNQESAFVHFTKEVFKPGANIYFLVFLCNFLNFNLINYFLAFCPFITNFMEKYFGYDAFRNKAMVFFNELMNDLYEQRKADPNAKEVKN